MSQLDVICKEFNKKYGAEILRQGAEFEDIPKIPFSSFRLNYMTYGGFPRGYMAEFYGDGGGGKTTTALDLLGNAQKIFKKEWEDELLQLKAKAKSSITKADKERIEKLEASGPKKCLFIDAETSFDREWATKLGVDVDDLYILTAQEQSGEELLQITLDLCETGEVGFLVVDSIGALYSEQEKEKNISEKVYCGIAGALTRFSKKITRLASMYNICVIMINQVREAIDSLYVTYKTTGGKAFKHHCALRIMFMKGKYLDEAGKELASGCEEPAGNQVKVHIEKTKKFAPNRKEGFYTLKYSVGVDKYRDLLDACLLEGHIVRTGAYYTFYKDGEPTENRFMGIKATIDFLVENPKFYEECVELLTK